MRHVLQYFKRKIYGKMILTSTITQHIKTKMNACKKLDMLPFAQSKMQYCSSLMLNGKHLFQIYKLQWRLGSSNVRSSLFLTIYLKHKLKGIDAEPKQGHVKITSIENCLNCLRA